MYLHITVVSFLYVMKDLIGHDDLLFALIRNVRIKYIISL